MEEKETLYDSRLVVSRPLSSSDLRPLHFPSFHVERSLSLSLHEFLANARDRWKQLSQPEGGDNDCAKPLCYYTFERFLDFGQALSMLFARRCEANDRSRQSLSPRFSLPALDQFLTALKRGMEKEYFLPRLLFLFEVCLLRDKVECIKSNVVLVLG